jgi:hypothetical protein
MRSHKCQLTKYMSEQEVRSQAKHGRGPTCSLFWLRSKMFPKDHVLKVYLRADWIWGNDSIMSALTLSTNQSINGS